MQSLIRAPEAAALNTRGLGLAFLLNLLWVNVSEVFRYFVLVMPMMRETMSVVPNVAPMNWPVFMIWGVWDTILVLAITLASWLVYERFGYRKRCAVWAGSAVWLAIFVIFWLAMLNMNLAKLPTALVALPLAWLEMMVAALIVLWSLRRHRV
jgi:hypothetical protein